MEILSVYASNTADAASQFNSISSAVSFPSAVTDPGYTSSLAISTAVLTGATPTHFSGGGATVVAGGAASGGVKGVEMGVRGLGGVLVMGCVGLITGVLMLWL